ncbi:MAG: thermostable hemolysin [Sphingomonadales bacterium]|nr:thermostable hemolysin [Sphingomonadales bacterium]MDE2170946.1 thermostable hemolysin [Sphingomonadales bacterium]
MTGCPAFEMIRRRYAQSFGADLVPNFEVYRGHGTSPCKAALGFRRASRQPLFLECYLDAPVEAVASALLNRPVARDSIVEIGNFAADHALAMIALWGTVSNDLAQDCELAVATLTRPLRQMFRRVGIQFHVLAPAQAHRLPPGFGHWGDYYSLAPQVCLGEIALAQQAIAGFLAPRRQGQAA